MCDSVAGPVRAEFTTTVYVMMLLLSTNVASPVLVSPVAGTSLAAIMVAVYVTVVDAGVVDDFPHDARNAAEAAMPKRRKDMGGSSRGRNGVCVGRHSYQSDGHGNGFRG